MFKTLTAAVALTLITSPAWACTSVDVEAKQGALIEAVQTLLATNPAKAQEIVATMQEELAAAQANGDDGAVCEMMDRLTAEAVAG